MLPSHMPYKALNGYARVGENKKMYIMYIKYLPDYKQTPLLLRLFFFSSLFPFYFTRRYVVVQKTRLAVRENVKHDIKKKNGKKNYEKISKQRPQKARTKV